MKPTPIPIRHIFCIGAGYVGGPTMAVMADRCPGVQVTVVDLNAERIAAWNDPDLAQLPMFEPGLDAVVGRARGRNLHFFTAVKKTIAAVDVVFISVNTPTKTNGLGAGQTSDFKWVEASARMVARAAHSHTIVVEKNTMPVRIYATVKDTLGATQGYVAQAGEQKTFAVLVNPDFLAKGMAIINLEQPDRVLIGGEDPATNDSEQAVYLPQSRVNHFESKSHGRGASITRNRLIITIPGTSTWSLTTKGTTRRKRLKRENFIHFQQNDPKICSIKPKQKKAKRGQGSGET
jgi:UDPglucose 6-dehydrogenase